MDIEKKAVQLSNLMYNRGLDKAQIRDLSGAVELLRQSLQYNKNNINARNLLGLVYFEMGEAVAALSEWVISKNLQPEDNIAAQYIDRLQSNQAKLSIINQTIRDYNIALENCRRGDEDIAAISLKKVIAQNSHFIKAYHLLALIYIKMERYTRARKLLRKAVKIDATNATTLRFMKEIDEQTGQFVRTEGRRNHAERTAEDSERVTAAVPFRERAPIHGLINLLLGLAVGVLAMWIVIVPSIRQSASRDVNERMVEYTNTLAVQENKISELQAEVDASKDTADSAQKTVDDAKKASEGTTKLLQAYVAYQDGRYTDAAGLIADVDSSLLSSDARGIYDSIYNETKEIVVEQYKTNGMNAFDYENWDEAIENLEKALELDAENYTVLDYLALSYRAKGEKEKAIELFKRIIELFPDTRRAESAEYYIQEMGGETGSTDASAAPQGENAQNAESAGEAAQNAGNEDTGEYSQNEENQDESYQEYSEEEYQEEEYWDEGGNENGDWE